MSHPHNHLRSHKVEHARVGHITKGYATGGAVHSDEKADRKLIKKMLAEHEKEEGDGKKDGGAVAVRDAQAVTGKPRRQRLDRPTMRARGGRTKHKSGKTNVNVIVAPQHGGMSPPPSPPIAAPHPPIPAPPVGVGGPPMAPGLPPGLPPRPVGPMAGPMPPAGAIPPRNRGGSAYAKGGAVKHGPAFDAGIRHGTKVQHTGNKGDTKNIGRGPVITKKAGGAIEHPTHGGMGPKLDGGGKGGLGRIEKAKMAAKHYAKPQGAHG